MESKAPALMMIRSRGGWPGFGVHALDKVVQRFKRAARLALGDNRLRHAGTHAADAGWAKAHAFLGSRELGTDSLSGDSASGMSSYGMPRRSERILSVFARMRTRQNGRHVLVRIVRSLSHAVCITRMA